MYWVLIVVLAVVLGALILRRPRIVCSMTTIPERLALVPRTLESLRKQTRPPDLVYIHVARETLSGVPYDLEALRALPNVRINVVPRDLGPITKVVPVENLVHPWDRVVLVDDDVVYQPGMIQGLLDTGLPAVGYAGRKDLVWLPGYRIKERVEADFLESYAGVMYLGSVLKGLGAFNASLGTTCIMQDDIKIGKFLDLQGVPRIIVPTETYCTHDPAETPQLKDQNCEGSGNATCFQKLFRVS